MAETYEFLFPAITALLALIPLVAVGRAWRRVRSPRLLLAALAFATFVLSGAILVVIAWLDVDFGSGAEQVEFGGDVVTVTLFALSFLWPRAEPDGA